MCLIAFALNAHSRWRFALAGNRDEFHARLTAAAGPLDDAGRVFGGRDLQAGGGWLQVSAEGRLAAVTNVRLGQPEVASRSRGALVQGFAHGTETAIDYAARLLPQAAEFGRFNVLLWDGDALLLGNHPSAQIQSLASGVFGLSNAALDTPWPKTLRMREALSAWLQVAPVHEHPADAPEFLEPLFAALANPAEAEENELPDTGVPHDWEKRLSAAFIVGADYGTRASTVVLADDAGLWFEERSFGPQGVVTGRVAIWLPKLSVSAERS